MDLVPASPLPAAVASPLQAIAQAELIINAVFLSLAPLQRALEHAKIQVKVVLAEALLPVHALATAPLRYVIANYSVFFQYRFVWSTNCYPVLCSRCFQRWWQWQPARSLCHSVFSRKSYHPGSKE